MSVEFLAVFLSFLGFFKESLMKLNFNDRQTLRVFTPNFDSSGIPFRNPFENGFGEVDHINVRSAVIGNGVNCVLRGASSR